MTAQKRECPHCHGSLERYEDPVAVELLAAATRNIENLHNMRTPKEIIKQTNELARKFYNLHGYSVPTGYRFDEATHPQECLMWVMACCAQLELTNTDVHDAIAELEP